MNKLVAFLKLIRLPNLIMLALVQIITRNVFVPNISTAHLFLISLATILIAAGGYIINDYFDYEIDLANDKKPFFDKKILKILALLFSNIGLVTGFYLSFISQYILFFYFLIAATILWFYAVFFSKYKIIGNISISILIAESILIIPIFSKFSFTDFNAISNSIILEYAALAFILNWIREIVKDLEDIKGDSLFGRKTLPLVLGIFNTKIMISILIVLSNIFLLESYFGNSIQIVVAIISSSVFLIFNLIRAQTKKEYKESSLLIKLIMLFGLLSPLFY